jgi:hypothetical protein
MKVIARLVSFSFDNDSIVLLLVRLSLIFRSKLYLFVRILRNELVNNRSDLFQTKALLFPSLKSRPKEPKTLRQTRTLGPPKFRESIVARDKCGISIWYDCQTLHCIPCSSRFPGSSICTFDFALTS